MTWDSGKDFGKFRRFLFCFLSNHFCKHLFYFHSALKRMQENWGAGIKRERRILELRSLANPFSVKICVLFCAVMKRCKEKSCPHIIHHEASQKDLWLEEQVLPTAGSSPHFHAAKQRSQRVILSLQQLSVNFGSGAATGKVSNSTFTHLWCQQLKYRNLFWPHFSCSS